jgi:hypothetical protein
MTGWKPEPAWWCWGRTRSEHLNEAWRSSRPTEKTFGGGAGDQLSSRGALGERAKAPIIDAGIDLKAPFRVRGFAMQDQAIEIADAAGDRIVAEEVIVATGYEQVRSIVAALACDMAAGRCG